MFPPRRRCPEAPLGPGAAMFPPEQQLRHPGILPANSAQAMGLHLAGSGNDGYGFQQQQQQHYYQQQPFGFESPSCLHSNNNRMLGYAGFELDSGGSDPTPSTSSFVPPPYPSNARPCLPLDQSPHRAAAFQGMSLSGEYNPSNSLNNGYEHPGYAEADYSVSPGAGTGLCVAKQQQQHQNGGYFERPFVSPRMANSNSACAQLQPMRQCAEQQANGSGGAAHAQFEFPIRRLENRPHFSSAAEAFGSPPRLQHYDAALYGHAAKRPRYDPWGGHHHSSQHSLTDYNSHGNEMHANAALMMKQMAARPQLRPNEAYEANWFDGNHNSEALYGSEGLKTNPNEALYGGEGLKSTPNEVLYGKPPSEALYGTEGLKSTSSEVLFGSEGLKSTPNEALYGKSTPNEALYGAEGLKMSPSSSSSSSSSPPLGLMDFNANNNKLGTLSLKENNTLHHNNSNLHNLFGQSCLAALSTACQNMIASLGSPNLHVTFGKKGSNNSIEKVAKVNLSDGNSGSEGFSPNQEAGKAGGGAKRGRRKRESGESPSPAVNQEPPTPPKAQNGEASNRNNGNGREIGAHNNPMGGPNMGPSGQIGAHNNPVGASNALAGPNNPMGSSSGQIGASNTLGGPNNSMGAPNIGLNGQIGGTNPIGGPNMGPNGQIGANNPTGGSNVQLGGNNPLGAPNNSMGVPNGQIGPHNNQMGGSNVGPNGQIGTNNPIGGPNIGSNGQIGASNALGGPSMGPNGQIGASNGQLGTSNALGGPNMGPNGPIGANNPLGPNNGLNGQIGAHNNPMGPPESTVGPMDEPAKGPPLEEVHPLEILQAQIQLQRQQFSISEEGGVLNNNNKEKNNNKEGHNNNKGNNMNSSKSLDLDSLIGAAGWYLGGAPPSSSSKKREEDSKESKEGLDVVVKPPPTSCPASSSSAGSTSCPSSSSSCLLEAELSPEAPPSWRRGLHSDIANRFGTFVAALT
ncbi:transcriptional activator MN1 [Anolis sagrei]|uniref:transcriptional activator MN1 n=1 Tax=Anolis sagrei TaxID=38937 RepID=UPI00352201BB